MEHTHNREDDIELPCVALGDAIQSGDCVHILHGGSTDVHGVFKALMALGAVHNRGVVIITAVDALHAFSQTACQKPLLVAVVARVIAEAPAAYDTLNNMPNVQVAVILNAHSVQGAPYSRRHSRIVVMALPSVRVDLCRSRDPNQVGVVYRCDQATFQDVVWDLPKGMGLCWRVADGKLCCVSLEGSLAHAFSEAQIATQRAWWWNAPPGPVAVPQVIAGLVHGRRSPFASVPGKPIQCTPDRSALVFDCIADPEWLDAARRTPAGDAWHECHLVDLEMHVTPCELRLGAHTVHDDPDTGEHRVQVTASLR